MSKPKKWTSARVCPNCGSRATKILSLNTGLYYCQVCEHDYAAPKPKPREPHHVKMARWRHNSFFGYSKMMQSQARGIIASSTTTQYAKYLAGGIEQFAIELNKELKARIDS